MDEMNYYACALAGYEQREMEGIEKIAQEQRKNYSIEDCKLAFSVVKTAFESSGREDLEGNEIYKACCYLNENPDGGSAQRKIASAIYTAIGRVEAGQDKVATGNNKFLSFLPWAAARTPDLAKLILGTGLVAGATAGAGTFGVKRMIEDQDNDLRKLEKERDVYARLSKEVENEMKVRGLANTPENMAATVDYLT